MSEANRPLPPPTGRRTRSQTSQVRGQRTQLPPVEGNVTVYLGNKGLDRTEGAREFGEAAISRLESTIDGTLTYVERDIQGLGLVPGILMPLDAYDTIIKDRELSQAIRAIEVSGVSLNLARDSGLVQEGATRIITTAPTPHTFALHQLPKVAAALQARPERSSRQEYNFI